MFLNLTEKIFSFFHRLVEKNYHWKKLSKIIKEKTKLENPLIFDVGCNEGEFIDFSLNLFKNPTIYSFEPETTSYQKLLEKYGKNNAINLYNFALGNKKEELYLNKNIKSSTSTLSKINTKSKYYNFKLSILNPRKKNIFLSKEKVKVEKIDDFFYQKKINTIDILKIDTEGFELNVIEGAINTLQKTRIIIIEFLSHDMYLNYDPKKIEDFLIANNFLLIKSIKYPLVKYEDRVYINKNIKNDY